jgi:hypothetical protein
MRRILITVLIVVFVVVVVGGVWIFGGRQLSLFADRFGTIEIRSTAIQSIAYEGTGTGGILHVNHLDLSLNETNGLTPNIGTSKDGQLALAIGGKVFVFGPPRSDAENLTSLPPPGDAASLIIRRSFLSWPTPGGVNFLTGWSPSWRRHLYYQIFWQKASGAKLEMIWRYEQYFYPGNGWASGFMTHEGSTGLIRADISP